jgi:hypothetical protein
MLNYKGKKLQVQKLTSTDELEITILNNKGEAEYYLTIDPITNSVVLNEYNKEIISENISIGTRGIYSEGTTGEKLRWEYNSDGFLTEESEDGIIVS